MTAVCHIGFAVTSSYFIRVLLYYVLNIDILGVSCFIILVGNCLFGAKFLGFWG